jgi:hypothetical protein
LTICVVGDPSDLSATYLSWFARRHGRDVVTLPEDRLGIDWSFHFDDDEPRRGWFQTTGERVPFADVTGVFVRFSPEPGLPDAIQVDEAERHFLLTERRVALHLLLDTFPATVVNRPSGGRSNGSKPYQMRVLAEAGFDVPAWTVTGNWAAFEAFERRCGDDLVYKASSGLRSRVRALDDDVIERLRRGTTPTVFQQRVDGTDVRTHVIADRTISVQIGSAGTDYRFDSTEAMTTAPIDTPPGIHGRCVRFARAEGLLLAGFDFRVTPQGRWCCLEANPAPTFIVYEEPSRDTVAGEIVQLLAP